MMGALLWHVVARKREGKASNIAKNGIPFPERKLALHLKTKGVTEAEMLQAFPQEPPLPPGFTCTTPPPRSTGQVYGISEGPYPVPYPETGFPAPSEGAKVPLEPNREAPFTPHATRRNTPAWLATLEMELDYSPTQSRYDFQPDGTFEGFNSGLLQGMDSEPWETIGLHTSGTQD